MVRIVDNNGQFKLTIPKDIVLSKGWSRGTRLILIENPQGDIMIREIKEKKDIKDKKEIKRKK